MTNSLTELLRDKFTPILAMMVYKSESSVNKFYIESHDVIDGQILAGKPLRVDTIEEILGAMYEEQKDQSKITGLIPHNLLTVKFYSGGKKYKMAWCQPEQKKKLFFAPQLKIDEGFAMVPPMIYMVDRGQLHVYALDSNDRPELSSKLYRAPFYNVSDSGDVCLGNASVNKPVDNSYQSIMKYWEDLFWLSRFTHVNGSMPVNGMEIGELWRNMIAIGDNATWIKNDQLVSSFDQLIYTDQKLEDIL